MASESTAAASATEDGEQEDGEEELDEEAAEDGECEDEDCEDEEGECDDNEDENEEEEEESEQQPMKRPAAAPLTRAGLVGQASSVALASAKKAAFAGNTSSHPGEYKVFLRAFAAAAKKDDFPIAASQEFRTNKNGLFKVFMDNERDIGKCLSVVVSRSLKKTTESVDKCGWRKKRDFCHKYGEKIDASNPDAVKTPKTDKVCERLLQAGLTRPDADFPNDAQEVFYYVELEQDWVGKVKTEEGLEARGKVELDAEAAKKLLGRGGLLHDNLMARVGAVSSAGEQSALQKFVESTSGGLVSTLPEGDPEEEGAAGDPAGL